MMPKKRVLYRRQTLYVENWRENILGWLNGKLPTRYCSKPARRRIEQLIAALQGLIRLRHHIKTIKREPPDPTSWFTRITVQMPSEASDSIRIIQRLIARYPSPPILGWDKEQNLTFGSVFTHLKRAEEEEAEAALAVMSLAEVNELTWLRQCLCGNWFFACRKTQRSCSPSCRHKLYEQTEKFKAKRRRYMKRYYRLQRSSKVK